MLDDRDQFCTQEPEFDLAQFNQDTRDSVRGKNNYKPIPPHTQFGGYWPSQPVNDDYNERFIQEDAFDPS